MVCLNGDESELELLPETLMNMPYTYSAKVSHERTFGKSNQPINENKKLPIKCGVCGSDNLNVIYEDYFAHNCGKNGTWEFFCLDCLKYTILFLED